MVQIIDNEGSISGRLGKGFGKGLADQAPREIDRYRLSSGLKNLANRSENMDPLQQVAAMYGIPGMTPEMMQTLAPIIRSMRDKKIAQDMQNAQPNAQPNPISSNSQFQTQSEPVNQPEYSNNQSNYLTPTDPNILRQKAIDISDKYGGDYNAELEKIKNLDAERVAAQNSYENRVGLGEKLFDDAIQLYLQKNADQTFSDITGEMQSEYRQRVRNLIDRGSDPRNASNSVSKDLLEFAKMRSAFRSDLGKSFLSISPSKAKSSAEKYRTQYADLGQREMLSNDLISSRSMRYRYANDFSYPIEETNRSISDEIRRSNDLSKKGSLSSKRVGDDKLFKDISDKISNSDSLSSIGIRLMKKGYDPNKFLSYVKDHKYQDLNERQKNELSNSASFNPTLNDLFFAASVDQPLIIRIRDMVARD